MFAPSKISQVHFNGEEVYVMRSSYGSLVGTVDKNHESIATITKKLPALTKWKSADGLPEKASDYDDSKWVGEFLTKD